MRRGLVLLAVLAVAAAFVVQPAFAGTISIQPTGIPANLTPGQNITGNIGLTFDTLIPRSSVLQAFVNNNKISELPLYGYLQDPSAYSYVTKTLQYGLTSTGGNAWPEFIQQSFTYRVSVSGTCGNTTCINGTTHLDSCYSHCLPSGAPAGWCANFSPTQRYPCSWMDTMPSNSQVYNVNGGEGLKFINNMDYRSGGALYVPEYANASSVVWYNTGNGGNSNVIVGLRAECGSTDDTDVWYQGNHVDQDGWVRREITGTDVPGASGYGGCRYGTIEPFDNSSLGTDRLLYNPRYGLAGGLYINGVYMQYAAGINVTWDGLTGNITICNWDSNQRHEIAYLPPNGPKVCAYTAVNMPNSSAWVVNKTEPARYFSYKNPQTLLYQLQNLKLLVPPPNCPSYVKYVDCTKTTNTFGAVKIYGPDVNFDYTYNSSNLTIYASTPVADFIDNQTVSGGINMASFQNLKAPTASGPLTLEFKISNNNVVLASKQVGARVCQDADRDGYCSIAEGGTDCNDTKIDVRPGASEKCNGADDNCNGQIDEGFNIAGKQLGTSCGAWNSSASACAGQWVCTPDGTNVTCQSARVPGELKEICDNGIDDDCDNVVDEQFEVSNGARVQGCFCVVGSTKQCGSSIGECGAGFRLCLTDGTWSDCKDSKDPQTETCNRKDDNCDGVVDNIGGGNSIESTKCGCYGGALPSEEICNGIDDNCDGTADNGIECCTEGQTRDCGLANGDCVPGTEVCRGKRWSGVCVGGIQPGDPRVDSNCNGMPACPSDDKIPGNCLCGNETYIDGYCCSGVYSRGPCANYNYSLWMIVAGGAILGVIVIWLLAMRFTSE